MTQHTKHAARMVEPARADSPLHGDDTSGRLYLEGMTMATLEIVIELGNAAFAEPGEVARILREEARGLENLTIDSVRTGESTVRDHNGNAVGFVRVSS